MKGMTFLDTFFFLLFVKVQFYNDYWWAFSYKVLEAFRGGRGVFGGILILV